MQRGELYAIARTKNPLRWKRTTRNWQRVDIVHLNPDQTVTPGDANITEDIKQKRAA